MIYRFGPFALDAAKRELRRDGAVVETEPKAFELLVYLAEQRERAVSKDELLGALWPRQIVTETALSRCVMKARRAVDDDADRQSVIRTLHGHGYRFVAALRDETLPGPRAPAVPAASRVLPASPVSPLPAGATARTSREPRRKAAAIAAAGTLVVLAVAGGLFLRQAEEPLSPGSLAVLPVADRTGEAELGWVPVGMMSLLARMLEDGGLDVVPEARVLEALEDTDTDAPPDGPRFERLQERTGAAAVLHAALERQPGLYRLVAVLTAADGRQTRRIIVGESPAGLAADLAAVVAGLMHGTGVPDDERFAKVSSDPFVNELYARALDLELQGEIEAARDMFRLASAQEPELFWLRYEIALCTRDLNEWEEAERQFAALYEEASSGADVRALVVTLNSRGVMHFQRRDYARAEADYLHALEVASERGKPADRATVLVNLGLVSTHLGATDAAREYYRQALAELEAAGRPPSGFFYNNYAGLMLEAGDLDAARTYSERAVETFRLHGQRRYEAPSLNRLGRVLRRQGLLDEATARHEQALTIYRELGDAAGELSVQSALTAVHRARGDLTRARNNALDVRARAAAGDDPAALADAHMQLAAVETDLGRTETALAEFEAAEGLFAAAPDPRGVQAARRGIAEAALASGDIERADALAHELLQAAVAAGNATSEARARWLTGRVAEARGATSAAAEAYGAALAYARGANDREVHVMAGVCLAELLLAEGRPDDAATLVAELEPLAGADRDYLRLAARLARALGDTARALELVTALRAGAGEAWTPDDDALLAELSR